MAKNILIIYTAIYLIRFFFHWFLTILNMNMSIKKKDTIPAFVQNWIDSEKYNSMVNYTLRKENFGLLRFALNSIVILGFIYLGIPGKLDILITSEIPGAILGGTIYVLAFSLILDLIGLPLDIYGQFIIEEEFGFNKMTGKIWFTDKLKEGILSLVIGIPLLCLLFLFMEKAGHYWWLYIWLSFSLIQLFLSVIYPTVIAPLFNKFTPLEEGELKESLDRLARESGFKTKGIFLMDGSRRSGHSNAYFTGLGKTKRIVLFDTLVEKLSTKELTAVMAHEIGHYKKHHIIKGLITSFISTLCLFFIISVALHWQPLFEAFSFSQNSSHGILIIILFFSSPLTYFLSPLLSHFSRHHEYQADEFASMTMGGSRELQEALIKLNRDNLSNLTPHPLYSAFYYSHPPIMERWNALEKLNQIEKNEVEES